MVELIDKAAPSGFLIYWRPGDQFGSFGTPQITQVGVELDEKLAALLGQLGLDVPSQLTAIRGSAQGE